MKIFAILFFVSSLILSTCALIDPLDFDFGTTTENGIGSEDLVFEEATTLAMGPLKGETVKVFEKMPGESFKIVGSRNILSSGPPGSRARGKIERTEGQKLPEKAQEGLPNSPQSVFIDHLKKPKDVSSDANSEIILKPSAAYYESMKPPKCTYCDDLEELLKPTHNKDQIEGQRHQDKIQNPQDVQKKGERKQVKRENPHQPPIVKCPYKFINGQGQGQGQGRNVAFNGHEEWRKAREYSNSDLDRKDLMARRKSSIRIGRLFRQHL